MPIDSIQIKRTKNSYVSSPSRVTLLDGELLYVRPEDAGIDSGKLYVGDGITNMRGLKDVGYTDRQSIQKNAGDITTLNNKLGVWSPNETPIGDIVRQNTADIQNMSSISSTTVSDVSGMARLFTSATLGLYTATTDGKAPNPSNTDINVGNLYLSLNRGVASNFDWDKNLDFSDPGSWATGDKSSKLLHNSKVYGFDARVEKIFNVRFRDEGIFGKNFVIEKTISGQKKPVVEFIRNDVNDIARMAGGEITYGPFNGTQAAFAQALNLNVPVVTDANIVRGTVNGKMVTSGAEFYSDPSRRATISNPNIVNPTFNNGFINNSAYLQDNVVTASKIAEVPASKIANKSIDIGKIKGKTGNTYILYSDASGNTYWGDGGNITTGVSSPTAGQANYLAYYTGARTIGPKVLFSSSVTNKFLNENGTWQNISMPSATYTTVGAVRPASRDFIVDNGNLYLEPTSKFVGGFAILDGATEQRVTENTKRYYGKVSSDGKTLTFIKFA